VCCWLWSRVREEFELRSVHLEAVDLLTMIKVPVYMTASGRKSFYLLGGDASRLRAHGVR